MFEACTFLRYHQATVAYQLAQPGKTPTCYAGPSLGLCILRLGVEITMTMLIRLA